MKEEDIIDTMFHRLRRCGNRGKTESKGFRVCDEKYCFVLGSSFSDLEDRYELETGSFLREIVSQVLADPS